MNEIEENLREVQGRIQAACVRAGRNRDEVTLIAVSKTKPVELLHTAMDAGVRVFGENRVQELVAKQEALAGCAEKLSWHMIGHLQTNKVKYLIGKCTLIHSVDSLRLAQAIEQESAKAGVRTDILVEVNAAGEESKFGVRPEDTEKFVCEIAHFPYIRVRGLMTVAPYTEKAEENRIYFRNLRNLLIDINSKNIDNIHMDVLSMGMTGDFEIAVEEGATCVRVGTGIFGVRSYTL